MPSVLWAKYASARIVAGAVALVSGLGSAAAPAAHAADGAWYIGGNLPLMFIDDTESRTTGDSRTPLGSFGYTSNDVTRHDTGFKLGAALGYEFGTGLRVEGELFFASAEVDTITYKGVTARPPGGMPIDIPVGTTIPASGPGRQLGGMVNLWYDLDTGSGWAPFFGGGLGFVRVDKGDVEYDTNALAQHVLDALLPGAQFRADVPELSATDTAFAWQLGGGLGYRFSDRITAHLGYRLQSTSTLEFRGENATTTSRATTDLRIHFLEAGLRYRF